MPSIQTGRGSPSNINFSKTSLSQNAEDVKQSKSTRETVGTAVDTLDGDNLASWEGFEVLENVDCVKVTVQDEFAGTSLEYTSGEGAHTVSVSNPCVILTEGQNMADWLLSVRQRRLYFDGESRGNPAVFVGDTITVHSAYGDAVEMAVESQELEFDGGLSANITALGGAWT